VREIEEGVRFEVGEKRKSKEEGERAHKKIFWWGRKSEK
jgi:hypothetical protein